MKINIISTIALLLLSHLNVSPVQASNENNQLIFSAGRMLGSRYTWGTLDKIRTDFQKQCQTPDDIIPINKELEVEFEKLINIKKGMNVYVVYKTDYENLGKVTSFSFHCSVMSEYYFTFETSKQPTFTKNMSDVEGLYILSDKNIPAITLHEGKRFSDSNELAQIKKSIDDYFYKDKHSLKELLIYDQLDVENMSHNEIKNIIRKQVAFEAKTYTANQLSFQVIDGRVGEYGRFTILKFPNKPATFYIHTSVIDCFSILDKHYIRLYMRSIAGDGESDEIYMLNGDSLEKVY